MSQSLAPFSCTYSVDFPDILTSIGCSLALTTYQSGKVILVSPTAEGIVQLPRTFPDAMGLAVEDGRMAVATRDEIVVLADCQSLAPSYPRQPNTYDSLFLPRAVYSTGRMAIHDLGWGRDGRLYAINTVCSCLSVIDDRHSFTPVWKPPFIERMVPDDACHLNGLAFEDGQPRFLTALGATSTRQGWRENKLGGGILIDLSSNEVILRGLAMPHSPRIIDGTLFLLNSAACELLAVDPETGTRETVVRLPGFARGLAAYGDYLFVGLSQLRHDHRVFGDLPIAHAKDLYCGILCVHRPSGRIAGELRYLRTCKEIYDIQMLPGIRRPGILSPANEIHHRAVAAPGIALWAPEPEGIADGYQD
ncbi:MAG: TIGR03032 family protein [Thermoanaerobaculia bacterium]|nr:TIGR03032 family protein [Thermoanaerobaculia bacterium]